MNAVVTIPHSETLPSPTQPEGATLLAVIARAAADPATDVDKMERLMAMKERMDAQQAETAFNAAMARVQAQMGRISADRENSQTRSWYATYGKLDAKLRPIYTAEGFSLSFSTEEAGENVVGVVCYVSHVAGHTRTYRAHVPSDGKGAKGNDVMTRTHAFGSGSSYGMRYLLKMIFNVAIGEDDDDGNGNGNGLDEKARNWIAVAESVSSYEEYKREKLAVLKAYGDKPANLPPAVREAFNKAAAETKPKD